MKNGKFVISLDFELMWGVRDKRSIASYGQSVMGVHQAVPRLLEIFNKFQVNATFSTVGLLFLNNKDELPIYIPEVKPEYVDMNLSPYNGYFDTFDGDENHANYHFAPQLLNNIRDNPGHEIGTHTFSHYYCLEQGQTIDAFRNDLKSAILVAEKSGITLTSLVFPRNQFNDEYLNVCREFGIICYRGNEHSWLYKAKSGENESKVRRAVRLLDSYINISGHNCYSDEYLLSKIPIDIPSSRFLRPYTAKLKLLESLRLNRIKTSMTYAAKNNLTYHLWWHPHNFGVNQTENFDFLENILAHYQYLNSTNNFQSFTMSGLAKKIINERKKNSYTGREGVVN